MKLMLFLVGFASWIAQRSRGFIGWSVIMFLLVFAGLGLGCLGRVGVHEGLGQAWTEVVAVARDPLALPGFVFSALVLFPFVLIAFPRLFLPLFVTASSWYLPLRIDSDRLRACAASLNFLGWLLLGLFGPGSCTLDHP